MTFITRITVFFFCLLFSVTAHAQIAYFFNIKAHNADAIQARLKKQLAKGTMATYRLALPPTKMEKDTFSVIAYSIKENCIACLDAFLAQKEKLAPYIDVQSELSKSIVFTIQNSNTHLFEYLIQQQHADINYACQICYNRSPLLMALSTQRYNFFFRLMDLGANPQVIDAQGNNAFHNLLMFYRKGNGVSDNNLANRTKLILEIIDVLAAKEVPIQQKNDKGYYPLLYAGYSNDIEVFDYMKSKGAILQVDHTQDVVTLLNHTLDGIYPSGPCLFDKVVSEYQIPLTKELFDTPDLANCYTILYAVYTNNRKVFDLLMDLSVNVNVKDTYNNTSINLAVAIGNAYMCDQLLNAGARLDDNTGNYKKIFHGNRELLNKFKMAQRSQ